MTYQFLLLDRLNILRPFSRYPLQSRIPELAMAATSDPDLVS